MASKSIEPDIIGRVMALEQRTRGLHGRLSALEIRFSSPEKSNYDGPAVDSITMVDLVEFVPGEVPRESRGDPLEDRMAALEAAIGKPKRPEAVSMVDITGLLVGACLLAVGVMLATDSAGLLKNPALAFAVGILIIACALGRIVLKR
jgi:hypothetical protein